MMLPKSTIENLKELIEQQETLIAKYPFFSPIAALEARYSLFCIKNILYNSMDEDNEKDLIQFLRKRWSWIKNTDIQYTHNIDSPTNRVCIAVAKALASPKTPYLLLLMRTLKKVPPTDYLVSSYKDDDVNLSACILSDDNSRLIDILAVLQYSKEDGHLRHNSLLKNNVIYLSDSEKARMIAKSYFMQKAIDAIRKKIDYMHFGDTAGAAVQRLINGLRDGGAHEQGEELNAAEQSNIAIVEFNEYVNALDEDTRKTLFSTGKFDRFNNDNPELITIEQRWLRLREPKRIEHQNELYCVEIISDQLEEILECNPGLYELTAYQSEGLETLASLITAVNQAELLVEDELHHNNYCYFYGMDGNLSLFKSLLPLCSQDKSFQLTLKEKKTIAKLSEIYFLDDPLSEGAEVGRSFLIQKISATELASFSLSKEFMSFIFYQEQSHGFFGPKRKKLRAERCEEEKPTLNSYIGNITPR